MAKKKGKILRMPKPVEPEPQVAGFTIAIGEQRLKFRLEMVSQEIRDGELVDISKSTSTFEQVVKPKASDRRRGGRRPHLRPGPESA